LVWRNKNGVAIRRVKNFEDMVTHFDTIHKRDRQTDGQTAHDDIDCAYA